MSLAAKLAVVLGACGLSVVGLVGASESRSADVEAITTTALDYGQGWYAADGDRMERALHPDLAKRARWEKAGNARGRINHMSAMTLVQMTRRGGGAKVPTDTRKTDVRILDIYGKAACVRLDMHDWIDYLHMSKIGDRWRIVNVLWELTPEAKKNAGFPSAKNG